MDRYVGKTVRIVTEQLFGATVKIAGELLEAEEEGWVIRTESLDLPKALESLAQSGESTVVYVPQRLILLATVEE